MAKTAVLKPFLAIATDKMKAKTVAELQARTEFKEGDVVEVLGELVAGDGKHHMRIASKVADASGVQGQGGLFWNVVPNSLISLIAQAIEQNKSDILLKRDKTDNNFGSDIKFETLSHLANIVKGLNEYDKTMLYKYLPKEDTWSVLFDTQNCPISKTGNGWCRLANGLIIQWGIYRDAGTEINTVSFPVAFTTQPKVFMTHADAQSITSTYGTINRNVGSFSYRSSRNDNLYSWFAIGV